jgi:hypothetical protein
MDRCDVLAVSALLCVWVGGWVGGWVCVCVSACSALRATDTHTTHPLRSLHFTFVRSPDTIPRSASTVGVGSKGAGWRTTHPRGTGILRQSALARALPCRGR